MINLHNPGLIGILVWWLLVCYLLVLLVASALLFNDLFYTGLLKLLKNLHKLYSSLYKNKCTVLFLFCAGNWHLTISVI